jgi:hypothetical protein
MEQHMNIRSGIALTAVAGLVLVPGALAQKPPKPPKPAGVPALAIDAKPNPVVFASPTTLSGRLAGPAGVEIRLEQDATLPLGDRFEPTTMKVRTANNGAYAFVVKPTVNTQYRVVAKTSPDTTGPARLVSVRPLVGLRVSSSTPRRGALVRFSGIVQPAHDGLVASIQRRTSSGGWATVSRTTLRDAGDAQSTYSRRVRVRSDGVYRVKLPGHDDHVNGFSRLRTLDVR